MLSALKVRPSEEDISNFIIIQSAIKDLGPKNICYVFTSCDLKPKFTKEKAIEWLEAASEGIDPQS